MKRILLALGALMFCAPAMAAPPAYNLDSPPPANAAICYVVDTTSGPPYLAHPCDASHTIAQSANQGTPNTSANAWPILLYDAHGTELDFTVPAPVVQSQQKPNGATQAGASANGANAIQTATMAAQSGKTNYACQVTFTAGGATAGLVVTPTVTGLLGGTRTYAFTFPAGVAVAAQPLTLNFAPCLPASASNTAVSAVLPAGGIGNTQASADIEGFFQ